MAVLEVNFTRMNLSKLKIKLAVATKGHRLLKSKVDGMIKKKSEIDEQIYKMKLEVSGVLKKLAVNYKMAKIEQSIQELNFLVKNFKARSLHLNFKNSNVMGVNLPVLKVENYNLDNFKNLNFLLFSSSQMFDLSVKSVFKVFPNLVLLAEKQKSAEILDYEIKKTRRKVNALEYLIIPNYVDTIKEIGLKLEENERNNVARLSRVKRSSFLAD